MDEAIGIRIDNLFVMLSYAFRALAQSNYRDLGTRRFKNAQNLLAAILARGLATLVKQGLYREYVGQRQTLSAIRGRIILAETLRRRMARHRDAYCEFDELSVNNPFNAILKTAMVHLLGEPSVDAKQKADLNRVRPFFDDVDILEPSAISRQRHLLNRQNRHYEMLLAVSHLVLGGLIPDTSGRTRRYEAWLDEQMAWVYEHFILAYYQRHHRYLSAFASKIRWNLSEPATAYDAALLPDMKTDITLTDGQKTLIIDAKYYKKSLAEHFGRKSLHSANLYQIFSYVKNEDRTHSGLVSGMLLYAKTGEAITPDCRYMMDGNTIGAKSLDLALPFDAIAGQLDMLAAEFFGEHPITDPVGPAKRACGASGRSMGIQGTHQEKSHHEAV